jgi:phosphatidylglycerol:prolipoprotein diacylglycerol transferase
MPEAGLEQWYHHQLDPIALQVGDAALPWYWLVYLFGWFAVYGSLRYTKPFMTKPADQTAQQDFLLWGWLGIIIGSRLMYVLIYNPLHYLEHPTQVIALWNGGMSFHGGFLGIIAAAIYVSKKRDVDFFSLTDPVAFCIPWILALGRLANFVNGELPGRISTVPWAVVFPAPFDGAPRHPSQLYEAILEGIAVGSVLWLSRRKLLSRPGAMSLAFTAYYAAARFVVEFTREPDPQIGLILGLTMGQWLCLGMIVLAISVATKLRATPK